MIFKINQKQLLENIFYTINYNSNTQDFDNVSEFENLLKESGFIIKSSNVDLIYFGDGDRPYQDSSGIEYLLRVENENYKNYYIQVQNFNGSPNNYRRIYCIKPKEFEDYSEWEETYDLYIEEFFEENNAKDRYTYHK